ncbi:glutaredoxin-like YruB-family protein [Hydrogenispora ethanolica]|uniref:Glutaredoxin-like YruB-family protein n=1 Tax=Hydrogenispora ethanolica TaxID=1082276 RepID=A0A4R1RM76_HYDET|nr:glutaredoxin family protein [Hydrogenispora ethanolica]TCL67363.1 glutaredoxin-like YruB-family protein [Hydrogenispora ethanolica]
MDENVTVYTTPTCPWCNKVKSYLSEKGVSYQEVDVAADDSAAQKLYDLTGQLSVPVITKGEQVVVGFNQAQLDKIIH